MATRSWLATAALAGLAAIASPTPLAQAEPLIPLTPGEIQYLEHARQIFAVRQAPVAFRSDGELLANGQYACDKRAQGYIGYSATYMDPVVNQLAFLYLCP